MTEVTHEFTATIRADGRKSVAVLDLAAPRNACNPAIFTTVRNIDGSNRLMRDQPGMWSYLPSEYEHAAWSAIAKASGETYKFAHCVPAWAR